MPYTLNISTHIYGHKISAFNGNVLEDVSAHERSGTGPPRWLSVFSAHFVYKLPKPRGGVKAQLMWGAASLCHQKAERGWFQHPEGWVDKVRGTFSFPMLPLSSWRWLPGCLHLLSWCIALVWWDTIQYRDVPKWKDLHCKLLLQTRHSLLFQKGCRKPVNKAFLNNGDTDLLSFLGQPMFLFLNDNMKGLEFKVYLSTFTLWFVRLKNTL